MNSPEDVAYVYEVRGVIPMFIQHQSNKPPTSIDWTDYSMSLLWWGTCMTDEPLLVQVTFSVISLNVTADLVEQFPQSKITSLFANMMTPANNASLLIWGAQ